MPHIYWREFNNGLGYPISNMNNVAISNATGPAGGLKSQDFVIALFQLCFAIESNGDIIPIPRKRSGFMYKTRKTTDDGINVGDPTKKILNSMIAALDVFFQCCRDDGYTAEYAVQLKESGEILQTHVLIL